MFLLLEKAECDLEVFARMRKIDVREFIDWMATVGDGLQFLHIKVRLVHFDLKPANLRTVVHLASSKFSFDVVFHLS